MKRVVKRVVKRVCKRAVLMAEQKADYWVVLMDSRMVVDLAAL